jgi:capsid protein
MLDALPAGHEVQSFDAKRPNVNFGAFYDAVIRNISASRGEPVSAVQLNFNQSYTGARGELLMFWMTVNRFRTNHGWDFEDDIFQAWFAGEIDRRRIDAPGFFDSDELRLAYTNAIWLGNRQPDIDPVKSVTAAIMEQDRGYRTGDEITSERSGGDYSENVKTIAQEFASLKASGSPEFQAAAAPNPAEPAPAGTVAMLQKIISIFDRQENQ